MEVQLGSRSYTLHPQKIGRIRRKFSAAFGLLEQASEGGSVSGVDDQLYEGLRVFIPDLAPKWELMGYANSDLDEPEDDAADNSPTPPQLAEALEAIFELHGGQRLVRLLKNVVGPEAIRALIRTETLRLASQRSQSLPRSNGASDSTPSTTTPPTSTENEGSPLSV